MPDGASDTVAAIATATAQSAGIGIVRISGARTRDIARVLFVDLPAPRVATLRDFRNSAGEIIDRGLVLFFPAPASYTGEDVLELHAHGGVAILQLLLQGVIESGARHARPGEFTERAFLNGRLDLLQAEAVADLIEAGSEQAARAAHATLRGEFSRRVGALISTLVSIRVRLEAGFDFSEEELDDQYLQTLTQDLIELASTLDELACDALSGVRLRDGLRVVLVGAPNVGKSSVLNRLAGEERAIVTEVPGTTRDVIREGIQLGECTIELMDTAGLHESNDAVERIGMARAMESAYSADLVLHVCDDRERAALDTQLLETMGDVLMIYNKIDLTHTSAGSCAEGIALSAITGAGFESLRMELARRCSFGGSQGEFSARQRHLDCLHVAREHLQLAKDVVKDGRESELCAEDLRQCQIALGRITGVVTSDDLLGEIFSSFCIGK
jgi:tRNA modification GTPase